MVAISNGMHGISHFVYLNNHVEPFFQILKTGTDFVGDASKDGFARINENLVFYDAFESEESLLTGIWNPQRTMDGGGNGQFQYYTDLPHNLYVNTTDGSLRIKPGLFKDLPPFKGVSAFDVMTGNCTPYPECATFEVPNCTTEPFGCKSVGDPLFYIMPTTSAKIDTKDTFAFTYGRMEIRARMARGDWLWPAIWMMPVNSIYGGWPSDGELDLVETKGNALDFKVRGAPSGRDVITSTLHYMGNVFWRNEGLANGIDWTENYNIFGLYWSDTEMYTYYIDEDGNEVKLVDLSAAKGGFQNGLGKPPLGYDPESKFDNTNPNRTPPEIGIYNGRPLSAPFDQPFYLILNVAVGGTQQGCPDGDYWGYDACWCDCYPSCGQPTNEFWKRVDEWYASWTEADKSDKLDLAIDWIKVWQ